jgi:hypothetical protein
MREHRILMGFTPDSPHVSEHRLMFEDPVDKPKLAADEAETPKKPTDGDLRSESEEIALSISKRLNNDHAENREGLKNFLLKSVADDGALSKQEIQDFLKRVDAAIQTAGGLRTGIPHEYFSQDHIFDLALQAGLITIPDWDTALDTGKKAATETAKKQAEAPAQVPAAAQVPGTRQSFSDVFRNNPELPQNKRGEVHRRLQERPQEFKGRLEELHQQVTALRADLARAPRAQKESVRAQLRKVMPEYEMYRTAFRDAMGQSYESYLAGETPDTIREKGAEAKQRADEHYYGRPARDGMPASGGIVGMEQDQKKMMDDTAATLKRRSTVGGQLGNLTWQRDQRVKTAGQRAEDEVAARRAKSPFRAEQQNNNRGVKYASLNNTSKRSKKKAKLDRASAEGESRYSYRKAETPPADRKEKDRSQPPESEKSAPGSIQPNAEKLLDARRLVFAAKATELQSLTDSALAKHTASPSDRMKDEARAAIHREMEHLSQLSDDDRGLFVDGGYESTQYGVRLQNLRQQLLLYPITEAEKVKLGEGAVAYINSLIGRKHMPNAVEQEKALDSIDALLRLPTFRDQLNDGLITTIIGYFEILNMALRLEPELVHDPKRVLKTSNDYVIKVSSINKALGGVLRGQEGDLAKHLRGYQEKKPS